MASREPNDRGLRSYAERNLESPFLEEELFAKEPEAEWEARVQALEAESPFRHAFERDRAIPSEPEEGVAEFIEDEERAEADDSWRAETEDYNEEAPAQLEEELVEEQERADDGDYAFHKGSLSDRGTFSDRESWNPAATLEFEAAGCTGEHELLDFEGELLDSEIWQGTADQTAFRDRVLKAHIARSQNRLGAAKRDLSPRELVVVAGTKKVEMRPEAAAAAGRLLAAANADLADARAAGHADALRTIRLTATSGYRRSSHQRSLWLRYFTAKGGYYDKTQTARQRFADGPHSERAVIYMLAPKKAGGFGLAGRIAAPGYSNHQGGIAIDFLQERIKGHEIYNKSDDESRAKWRSTWFHGWLKANAANFGFQPLATEEWHWEYRPGSSTSQSTVKPTASPAARTAQPAAELVRFAQRVLNAAEGERLEDDGDLGRLTRAALERFRQKYGLGLGGVLNASTELALAQRALEELAQASMFAQLGTRDTRTEQALITFKAARQLGVGATLDAATRRALTDALARMASKNRAGAFASEMPDSATPSTYLGGKLWTFPAKTAPTPVAVFCPQAALRMPELEVLVYAHGLVKGCKGPKSFPDGIITDAPFKLGDIVAASGRPIVLVVPYLNWAKPGGESAFGKQRRKWHALGKPAHLNSLVAEVLAELGRVQSIPTPSLRNLVIAGHSRAYDLLEPLAHSHTDPQMRQGALARLSEVWAFDTTYGGRDVSTWMRWLDANRGLKVSVFYEPYIRGTDPPEASRTSGRGGAFYRRKGGRLEVIRTSHGHCNVPAKRLGALLKPSTATTGQETEATWGQGQLERDQAVMGVEGSNREFDGESHESFEPAGQRQEVDHFDPLDGLDADEQRLSDEPELAALAFEALGSDDERTSHDEDEEFEFEDEEFGLVVEAGEDEPDGSLEARELDPVALDIAEKTIAREVPSFEGQIPTRWTRCFSATDIAQVEKVYRDNAAAASANSVDRCSCIVMLNVALGQLLSLRLKGNPARGESTRIVQMGDLTTASIEKAMTQLRRRNYALAPTVMNFFDRRNRSAGTLKPERLKASVQAKVLGLAKTKGCWFAFGLSIMDGYHSILLLVDHTAALAKIYWLDQFSPGITDDVTGSLDQRITDKTQAWWQAVMDTKGKGYNTTIRIWPLRKHRKTS